MLRGKLVVIRCRAAVLGARRALPAHGYGLAGVVVQDDGTDSRLLDAKSGTVCNLRLGLEGGATFVG